MHVSWNQNFGMNALEYAGLTYSVGMVASALKDRGLCSSGMQRLNASHDALLKTVLEQDLFVPHLGHMFFEAVPSGLSRSARVLMSNAEPYEAYLDIVKGIDSQIASLMSMLALWRSVGVIGREGQVSLKDGYLNIPASRIEEVFGRPVTFMGNAIEAPRDFIADSCGRKAVVNGSKCLLCDYGFALPMNGTNKCLPAAEECMPGTVWNFAFLQCEQCNAGRFSSVEGCLACPEGRASLPGKTSCDLCSTGYYRSSSANGDCLFCTDGDLFVPYRATEDACVFDFQFVPWLFALGAMAAAAVRRRPRPGALTPASRCANNGDNHGVVALRASAKGLRLLTRWMTRAELCWTRPQ